MAFKQMLVMLVVLVTGMMAQAAETPPTKSVFSQLDVQVASIESAAEPNDTFLQEAPIDRFNQLHHFSEGELIELVIDEEDDDEESNQKLRKGTEDCTCNPFALTNGICFADFRNESVSAEFAFVYAILEKRFVLINVFRI